MAVRNDIHIEWYRSPRIIVIESPSLELDLQDLVDTMAEIESSLPALDDDSIVQAGGKQEIGENRYVGITVTLNNAQVSFEQRTVNNVSGLATAATVSDRLPGQILQDNLADFVSAGVKAGDTVINFSDNSIATIIGVVDANHVRHYALQDGSQNEWTIGDAYKIFTEHFCQISGGNLVALDPAGDPLVPIVPSAFTYTTRELSTSASLQQTGISGLTAEEAAMLQRILGLVQENYYLDQTSYIDYSGQKLLAGGRMRIYSDPSSIGTDDDVIATYIITPVWSGNELQTYKVEKQ